MLFTLPASASCQSPFLLSSASFIWALFYVIQFVRWNFAWMTSVKVSSWALVSKPAKSGFLRCSLITLRFFHHNTSTSSHKGPRTHEYVLSLSALRPRYGFIKRLNVSVCHDYWFLSSQLKHPSRVRVRSADLEQLRAFSLVPPNYQKHYSDAARAFVYTVLCAVFVQYARPLFLR